jgi:hypothetical protein
MLKATALQMKWITVGAEAARMLLSSLEACKCANLPPAVHHSKGHKNREERRRHHQGKKTTFIGCV